VSKGVSTSLDTNGRWVAVLALLLGGCGKAPEAPAAANAGAALEATAIARGIVADPAKVDPVGLYGSDSDRLCVVPAGEGYRVGAAVDYGEGQGCFATGEASGRGTLDVQFGEGCRVSITLEGDRASFPATLPAGCDRFCTGRASLAALSADRISGSATEAASAVTAAGAKLCP
jgi:hypothetical protein